MSNTHINFEDGKMLIILHVNVLNFKFKTKLKCDYVSDLWSTYRDWQITVYTVLNTGYTLPILILDNYVTSYTQILYIYKKN